MPEDPTPPGEEPRRARPELQPLSDLMQAFDEEVQRAVDAARSEDTGTGLVRTIHDRLVPTLVVHDTTVASALCPVLDQLPGGQEVADQVRQGCRERGDALRRFDRLTRGVAAPNVYAASGDAVDAVLDDLGRSFDAHRTAEAAAVRGVLVAAGSAVDPIVVADRMATVARRAPTRPHGRYGGSPASALALAAWRQRDRLADWVDAHHGWWGDGRPAPSPRRRQVVALQRLALGAPSTVRGILSAYDDAVGEELAALDRAGTDAERAEAAHRVTAAIAIHDAVVGGVVCPLLQSRPGSQELAGTLHQQCGERADLLRSWLRLTRHRAVVDLYREQREAADGIMGSLAASFAAHEHDETEGVTALLEDLPPERFRRPTAPFADSMWPWHSEGPNLLALRMAMWASRSPTRPHPGLLRHPSSRVLRTAYDLGDNVRDRWNDTPLTRWLFPPRPAHPLVAGSDAGGRPPAVPTGVGATSSTARGDTRSATDAGPPGTSPPGTSPPADG